MYIPIQETSAAPTAWLRKLTPPSKEKAMSYDLYNLESYQLRYEFEYAGREVIIVIEDQSNDRVQSWQYDVIGVLFLDAGMDDFATVTFPSLREMLIRVSKPAVQEMWEDYCHDREWEREPTDSRYACYA